MSVTNDGGVFSFFSSFPPLLSQQVCFLYVSSLIPLPLSLPLPQSLQTDVHSFASNFFMLLFRYSSCLDVHSFASNFYVTPLV